MRHSLLYLLLACTPIFSTAQTYQPLLTPGRTWLIATSYAYEQCFQSGFPPWSDCITRERYFLSGDTVIQGVSFQKCMRQGFSLASGWQQPFTISAPEYVGALREDIDNRQVFAYDTASHSEVLVYDFSLLQGESAIVRLQPFTSSPTDYTMTVDTVFTLPDGRKKWIMNQYQEMVEGVGMNTGLFPTEICFEVCVTLACISENGIAVLDEANWPFVFFGVHPICNVQIVSQQAPEPAPTPEIFPNPGTGIFEVRNIPQDADIQVYSAAGEVVIQQKSGRQVDLQNAPAGIYFLRWSGTDSGLIKLIKE